MPAPRLRVVFGLLYYDEARAQVGAAEYLKLVPLHRELAVATARLGHDVEVVMHFASDAMVEDGGVRFRFIAPSRGARLLGSTAKRFGRHRAHYEPPFEAIDAITGSGADIVHFHGTSSHLNLALLAARLRGPRLVVQFHGGGPARTVATRALQRFGLGRADRVLFTSARQALPFVDAGVLADTARVETALEISSPMVFPGHDEALRATGFTGRPICLSVGRLHPDKDPLTMVRGFEIVARSWPEARLYLCYGSEELLADVRRFLASRPALSERVQLLGHVPYDRMGPVFASADFLLQASLREVAGIAIVEAIAAGTFPVLTRIAAFEEMTEGGRHAVLFEPGDAEGLARGVLSVDLSELPARRRALRDHFEARLSYAAMARRLEAIYSQILAEPSPTAARRKNH
jgi:glycosyltransferase involved in cell wall biosynthesis